MAKRQDTNHQVTGATGIFYLSDQDISELSGLTSEGFDITFQQVPSSSSTTWEDFTKTV